MEGFPLALLSIKLRTCQVTKRIDKEATHSLEATGVTVFAVKLAIGKSQVEIDRLRLLPVVWVVNRNKEILVEIIQSVSGSDHLVIFSHEFRIRSLLSDQYNDDRLALV